MTVRLRISARNMETKKEDVYKRQDIDDQVIASAKAGLYSAKSVENVPADLKKKYFTQVEGSYKISDDIKRCVTFKEHNLLKDSYPKDYDCLLYTSRCV